MKNSVRHVIASGFLLSLFGAGVCVLQAQESGSATVEPSLKFQPQLVTKTVSVINPLGSWVCNNDTQGDGASAERKRAG